MENKYQNFLKLLPILFALFLGILWQLVPELLKIPVYIFPKLSTIIVSISNSLSIFKTHIQITFTEAICGFLLGSFLGFTIGVFMAESKIFTLIALPYVIASNAVPVIAIAPLILLWFGHGILAKIIVSAFLCFFPLCINTYRGLSEYPKIYEELFKIYGSSKKEFFLKYKLPNSLPFIFSGLKLNATFSVVGAIVAEFVGANSGLGFGMLNASYNLNTPRLWGYIIIACLLGILFYYFIYFLEKKLFKKYSFKSKGD